LGFGIAREVWNIERYSGPETHHSRERRHKEVPELSMCLEM
jgi:hypothetical protein